jgi:hypothetical protein
MATNGEGNPTRKDAAPTLVHTMVIQYVPATMQFAVQWPQADAIVQLGMLEFAKMSLAEQRLGATERRIIAPNGAMVNVKTREV